MCCHLNMNTKPILGLFVWVITLSLSLSHSPAFSPLLFFLSLLLSSFLLLFSPCKLDSGSITMLLSSFPSLWPNYLVFHGYWAWFIGCSFNQRATQGYCPVSGLFQSKDRSKKWIPFYIQPQATNKCLLHVVHCDRFIKEDVNKCLQEAFSCRWWSRLSSKSSCHLNYL